MEAKTKLVVESEGVPGQDVPRQVVPGQVHTFSYRDKNIVLDVNSNSLFTVDVLAMRMIPLMENLDVDELVVELTSDFAEEVVREAYEELSELVAAGILFSVGSLPQANFDPEEFEVKSMCLHVSHDCNLRCRYCFAGTGPYGQERTNMSYEMGKKAIDFLVGQAKNTSFIEIDFFGGEPLLNFPVVKQLVHYARELEPEIGKTFNFSLTTNGVLLNEEIEGFIADQGINLILSIDGRKEINDLLRPFADGTGSYDQLMNIYQKLNAKRAGCEDNRYGLGVYTYYRGTFTSENLDFDQDVLHLSDQGFRRISIEPVILPENRRYALRSEHLPEIYESYDRLTEAYLERLGTDQEFYFHHFEVELDDGPCYAKRITGCGAGYHYIAVTPEGDIYPCHQFVGNRKWLIGNLEEGFTNKAAMNLLRDTNIYTKEECRTCWVRHFCGGGCHVNADGFNGDVAVPHAISCEMMRKRYENALYLKVLELENTDQEV